MWNLEISTRILFDFNFPTIKIFCQIFFQKIFCYQQFQVQESALENDSLLKHPQPLCKAACEEGAQLDTGQECLLGKLYYYKPEDCTPKSGSFIL